MTDTTDNRPKEDTPTQPDFRLISLTETLNWNLPEWLDGLSRRVVIIERVYLYDRNRHVHACELTPSYELTPFESSRPVWRDGYEPTERERENLEEIIRDAESDSWETIYMHVHTLDSSKRPTVAVEWGTVDWTEIEGDTPEEKYQNLVNEVVEHLRANPML